MRSQAFTTGSNRHGYELSAVALGKYYKETTLIELSIYSVDTNGHPQTLLFAFTNPDAYTNDTQAFNAPARRDPGPRRHLRRSGPACHLRRRPEPVYHRQ